MHSCVPWAHSRCKYYAGQPAAYLQLAGTSCMHITRFTRLVGERNVPKDIRTRTAANHQAAKSTLSRPYKHCKPAACAYTVCKSHVHQMQPWFLLGHSTHASSRAAERSEGSFKAAEACRQHCIQHGLHAVQRPAWLSVCPALGTNSRRVTPLHVTPTSWWW
jgi:hypothetical protein